MARRCAAEHGGPARLLVPHLYFWKSAKWLKGLRFTRARRGRILGTARLSHVRRPLARAALHERSMSARDLPLPRRATLAAGGDRARSCRRRRASSSVFLRASLGPYRRRSARRRAADGARRLRRRSAATRSPRRPARRRIELAIERLDDGEVSPLFPRGRAGRATRSSCADRSAAISSGAPQDGGPLLLIGGGSGVVPLMAMVRHRARVARRRSRSLLVYSSRTWDEIIFRDELLRPRSARRRTSTLVMTTTRGPRHRPDDFDRRLDRPLLRGDARRAGGARRGSVYVCGSNAFVEAATLGLVVDGVPAGRHSHRALRRERPGCRRRLTARSAAGFCSGTARFDRSKRRIDHNSLIELRENTNNPAK